MKNIANANLKVVINRLSLKKTNRANLSCLGAAPAGASRQPVAAAQQNKMIYKTSRQNGSDILHVPPR
jgi:hypothetical protein